MNLLERYIALAITPWRIDLIWGYTGLLQPGKESSSPWEVIASGGCNLSLKYDARLNKAVTGFPNSLKNFGVSEVATLLLAPV